MKLVPLGNNVVVKRSEAEAVSKGGIVLPDTFKQKPAKGEVLAVGPGQWQDLPPTVLDRRRPLSVKVGEVVVFSAYSGVEVECGGQTYLVLPEDAILAVEEA